MSWGDFERAIDSGRLPPVLVFYGPESALRARAVEFIREAAPEAVLIRFEGNLSKLHEELFTGSLFSEQKIVVAEPEEFPKEWVESYAASPADGVLLLVFSPGNRAPLKARDGLLLVSCSPPKGNELAGQIERELRRHDKSIESRAADRFAARLGGSYARMQTEVEKIVRYLGKRSKVTQADVDTIVTDEESFRAFDLVNRIVSGDESGALKILHRLLDQGEPVPMIMGSLGWQIRKMVQVRNGIESGLPGAQAAKEAGVKWGQAEFGRRVAALGRGTLLECHDRLLQTDAALKSSGGDEQALLDALVLRLVGQLGRA